MRLLPDRFLLNLSILFLATLCCSNIFSQDSLTKAVTYLPLKSNYPTVDGQFHGLCRRWHSNGQLASTGYFIHGKQHGKWFSYYENGKLQSKITYKTSYIKNSEYIDTNGIVTNVTKSNFFRTKHISRNVNGIKTFSTTYKRGEPVYCNTINKMNGRDTILEMCFYKTKPVYLKNGKYFDNSGKIIKQKFKGKSESWFENGNKKSLLFYRQGKIDGTWMEWDIEENIIKHEIYKKGVLILKIK